MWLVRYKNCNSSSSQTCGSSQQLYDVCCRCMVRDGDEDGDEDEDDEDGDEEDEGA